MNSTKKIDWLLTGIYVGGKNMKKKCLEIVNDLIDTSDIDIAIQQLRNLESERVISKKEYDYILQNYDKLISK